MPDVYLEVQHPCWSCNSNSSSANASAARCLFRSATPLLVLQFQQFVGERLGGRAVAEAFADEPLELQDQQGCCTSK